MTSSLILNITLKSFEDFQIPEILRPIFFIMDVKQGIFDVRICPWLLLMNAVFQDHGFDKGQIQWFQRHFKKGYNRKTDFHIHIIIMRLNLWHIWTVVFDL